MENDAATNFYIYFVYITKVRNIMRKPGIEPGLPTYKEGKLTTIIQALRL